MHPAPWVPLIISEAKVIDLDGEEVTLRFRLAPTPDPEWEELFEKAVSHHVPGPGRPVFTFTSPAIIAGIVTCKIAEHDISGARLQMRELVDETNRHFAAILHERAALAAYQLERARQRRRAIAEAQRLLDQT
jgi:hypothetical protein